MIKRTSLILPHTWTKGLDYEVKDRGDYINIASNEGDVNYMQKEKLHEAFLFAEEQGDKND